MLVCVSCGRILLSDGVNWVCPKKDDSNAHVPKCPPTVIRDKRYKV